MSCLKLLVIDWEKTTTRWYESEMRKEKSSLSTTIPSACCSIADSHIDLAVIAPRQYTDGSIPKLKPMVIGDADKLRKGSFLIALGNPFDAAKDGEPSAAVIGAQPKGAIERSLGLSA